MWLVAVVGRCVVGCEHCEGYCSNSRTVTYCWMWMVAVVGRCVVGCEHCEGYCSNSRTVTYCWMWMVAVVGRCYVVFMFAVFKEEMGREEELCVEVSLENRRERDHLNKN